MKRKRLALAVVFATVAAAYVIGPGAGTAAAQVSEFCTPPTGIGLTDRTLDVWYGTLTIKDASGAPYSTADFVRFDKAVSTDVVNAIAAEPPDPRLASLLPVPPGNTQAGDLVATDPAGDAGDDAEQALRDAYAAAASAAGAGSARFLAARRYRRPDGVPPRHAGGFGNRTHHRGRHR